MSRRVRKPVKPEKLRQIAEFLRIAHDLPEIAEYLQQTAAELEHYKDLVACEHRQRRQRRRMRERYHVSKRG